MTLIKPGSWFLKCTFAPNIPIFHSLRLRVRENSSTEAAQREGEGSLKGFEVWRLNP